MSRAERPRVLILGGGFAGVGAAQKLEGRASRRRARRPARLPHLPAAPLPARDRAAGDERGRASAPRPVPRPANMTIHKTAVTRHRPREAEVRFDERGAASPTTISCSGSAPKSTSSAPTERLTTRFPMYTLADAVRLQEPCPRAVGGGRPRPEPGRGRRAQRRRRRRRPDRRRDGRCVRRALPRPSSRKRLPGISQTPKHG